MAAIRISQLAEVTSVTNDDVLVINDGDINTRKITYSNLTAGLIPAVGNSTISGNLTLSGTLNSLNLLVDNGTLAVDNTTDRVGVNVPIPQYDLDIDGTVQVRGGSPVRLNDPNNSYAVSFQTPVLTANQTYAFPTTFPSTSGLVLSSTTAGVMSWVAAFTDPMTTVGDLLFRDAANATARLPIGGLGQVLTVQGDGTADWQNPAAGFTDPMTNAGDIILRDNTNSTTRLGIGVAGAFLSVNNLANDLEWTTSTSANLSVGSLLTVQGDGASGDGRIKLNCSQNSHGVTIQAPPHSAAASYTLTLPDDVGTNGQVLTTDGTGALSFTSDISAASLSVSGNTTLGDANTDAITFTGRVDSNVVPLSNNTRNLGGPSLKWNNIYVNLLHAGGLTYPTSDGSSGQVLSTDGSGSLGWVAAGGNSQASSFTWNASILPDTDATYDLGSASFKVRHLFLSDNSIKFESGDLGVTGGALTFQGEAMQVGSLNAVLTTLGVSTFVDNAGALGGGLVIGDVYYNSTSSKLTSVTA